jgi:Alpha/beta hydrolase domain
MLTARGLIVAAVASALALATAMSAFAAPAAGEAATTVTAKSATSPSAADPTVSAATGGTGISLESTSFSLSSVGYEESEYFLSGTATAYKSATALSPDGDWTVTPASTASYETRVVVYRPSDAAKFNGTVIVEWLNDTAGLDTAAEWIYGHTELIRDGYAWVGVSAQQTGVNELKLADVLRYGSLSHPGDSYSYDIYSQAGQAIWDDSATILGGLKPKTLLGNGESQSALRLTTYIDAIQPRDHVYDGFLVHSRFGSSAPLSESPQAEIDAPSVVYFRSDLGVPILDLQTETDLFIATSTTITGINAYLPAQQGDTSTFRLWEVAGTAHADDYEINAGAGDTGDGTTDTSDFSAMLSPPSTFADVVPCNEPLNTGEEHYVLDEAEYALNRWVTTGTAPAHASRLDVNAAGTGYVTDANGNVEGGIRTPAVQVPVATLSGLGNGSVLGGEVQLVCSLTGTTTPFSPAKLASLYPTHAQFVNEWRLAAASDTLQGFIRPADEALLIQAAQASSVG